MSAAELQGRLPSLLADLRRVSVENSLEGRLARMLERLRRALPSPGHISADRARLSALLPDLSKALAQASLAVRPMNPWTVAGARRREVRNAAILAALWSPTQVGDVGATFLAEFFVRCGRAGQGMPTAGELALGYRVRVENCPAADGADRVDVVIETARHLIGIEVKVDAGEGPEQIARYVEAIARGGRQLDKVPRVILLAPFAPSREDVVAATWSDVRAAAAAALPPRRAEHGFTHHLVAQFARHVRSF